MQEQTESLLTVGEVAPLLRVDETTGRRWIKCGSLDAIILPHPGKRRTYRIKQTTIQATLKFRFDSADLSGGETTL